MKNIITLINKAWYCYTGLFLFRREPVVILSPGRTGSMALHAALKKAGVFVFKVEFEDDSRGTAKFAKRHILYGKRPAKIIVLYRDHVDMMITYFFSKAHKGWLPEAKKALEKEDVETLISIFKKEILFSERANKHKNWYEKDLPRFLGNSSSKYAISSSSEKRSDGFKVLKIHLESNTKAQEITDFLHLPKVFTWEKNNSSTTKKYHRVYNTFKTIYKHE